MRSYIENNSIFDSPPYYQASYIKRVLKANGIKYVSTAHAYGWSNQPKVVTFRSEDSEEVMKILRGRADIHPLLTKWDISIREAWK